MIERVGRILYGPGVVLKSNGPVGPDLSRDDRQADGTRGFNRTRQISLPEGRGRLRHRQYCGFKRTLTLADGLAAAVVATPISVFPLAVFVTSLAVLSQ